MADLRRVLEGAQAALRARIEDFHGALGRRDAAAYRLALADFQEALARWISAQREALLPALERADIAGRDVRRELTLEWVQLSELTRHLRQQIEDRAPLSDVLGLAENLFRRFEAHERGMLEVYYRAAAPLLNPAEQQRLESTAAGL